MDNSLLQNTSQPSILSVVPTIGPLHISLNSREHVVNSYHSFFKTVYETIFPRSKLADNPKPWRISLILEIVCGGWTLIRQTVMRKFLKFKDVEYGTLYNLLDNYIPLVLSIYSISFKLNNFSEYFRAMIRIWIMFTCLQRRHYNKAPLIWINMCSHWGKNAPQLYIIIIFLQTTSPFLMSILWKTLIAYSVHKQTFLTLLMNLERKPSLFSNQKINNHISDHFSPHLNSFHFHTINFVF